MNRTFNITRRSFLRRCSATAAATGLPLWVVSRDLAAAEEAQPAAAGTRPRVALIGSGGMGTGDARNAANYADLVAVCDVDSQRAASAAARLARDGSAPEVFGDFRRVLERTDIQAIINGTPDHWHSPINIAAARAGKDIYCEKPLTLTLEEGRRVVEAVRRHKVVLQTGTQQRSSQRFRLACEIVRNGRLGKLQEVQVFVPAGLREGPFAKADVPAHFNYDFWLGQAPAADYCPERCHGTFRWWYDYAGGPVTDWGAHHNDIARWGIGQDGPLEIEAHAITPPIDGGYTTPSEFEATLNWAGGVVQHVRTTTDDTWTGAVIRPEGQRNGVKFIGPDGWIWVNRDEISASDKRMILDPLPDDAVRLEVSNNHMANFFDCVKSRRDPVAAVETGHRSASVGHLIIIALRTGLKLQWDAAREVFTGADAAEANRHLGREMRKPYDHTFAG